MADTLGGLIDKLFTVDMKLWNNVELIHAIRHMGFEEFKNKFLSNDKDARKLWEGLKKCCDLNFQRNQLIDEIDERVVEMIKAPDLDKFIQRKHKTC